MCEACETARKVLKLLAEEAARQGYDVQAWKRYDSAGEYADAIQGAARQFWKEGSRGSFLTRMREIIRFGLRSAFISGADAVGVPEEELSPEEITARDAIIKQEADYLDGLADHLQNVADSGGTLDQVQPRLGLWAQRWKEIYDRAQVVVGKDQKLEWVMNTEKENCNSCIKLNGIVKRASFWNKAGVLPRVPGAIYLTCGGWQCGCELQPTDKPIKRGRLPKLP